MKSIYPVLMLTASIALFVGCGSTETESTELPSPEEVEKQVQPPPEAKTAGKIEVPKIEVPKGPPPASDPPETKQPVKVPVALKDIQESAKKTKLPDPAEVLPSEGAAKSLVDKLSIASSETVANLMSSLKNVDPSVVSNLNGALDAFAKENDQGALKYLAKFRAASLTPEQTALAAEVRDVIATAVLERNFEVSGDGDIAKVVSSIKSRDTPGAVSGLRALAGRAGLTAGQRDLLQTLITDYAPQIAAAAESLKGNLKSVNPLGD